MPLSLYITYAIDHGVWIKNDDDNNDNYRYTLSALTLLVECDKEPQPVKSLLAKPYNTN